MSEHPDFEKVWHEYLTGKNLRAQKQRHVFGLLPSEPRCKLCNAPFSGIGGVAMRTIRRGPSSRNPKFCRFCIDTFEVKFPRHEAMGAEVPLSILFADVRGSTQLSERLPTAEYSALMSRYYEAVFDALVPSDALVDRLVGDQVVALYLPVYSGEGHAHKAVEGAGALLRSTGHAAADTPWIPVGVGVHTGTAFVGVRGSGQDMDLFATGEAMNLTARLSSEAAGGEILVSEEAALAAGLDSELTQSRHLPLKGLSQPVSVRVLRP